MRGKYEPLDYLYRGGQDFYHGPDRLGAHQAMEET